MIVRCNFCLWSGNVDLGTEICPYCKEEGTLLEGEFPENEFEDIPEENIGLDNENPDVDVPYDNGVSDI